MKLFNFKKLSILTLVLALATSLIWTKPTFAHVEPADANTDEINLEIARAAITYKAGDHIHYTVSAWIPTANTQPNQFPAQQANIVVTFTAPNKATVTFPAIPVLNPGEKHTFTETDSAVLDYVINPADEDALGRVTALANSTSIAHVIEGDNHPASNTALSTEVTVEEATPTQAPNQGGGSSGGDNRSDNLGCSVHDCSGNKVAPAQAVLGASTILPNTGFGPKDNLFKNLTLLGIFSILLILYPLARKKV